MGSRYAFLISLDFYLTYSVISYLDEPGNESRKKRRLRECNELMTTMTSEFWEHSDVYVLIFFIFIFIFIFFSFDYFFVLFFFALALPWLHELIPL